MVLPSSENKQPYVKNVFDSVAARYDLMNDAMSLGVHRLWKKEFVSQLALRPQEKLLDMAGGTGDIAFRVLKKSAAYSNNITIADINTSMLREGRKRALDSGTLTHFNWLAANAEHLPLASNTLNAYTIAFGLRNVTHITAALAEAHRVLKPGGRFLCLEFSAVSIPFLAKIYDAYSYHLIPRLGQWLAKDAESYEYLVDSIRAFPPQEKLLHLMAANGFRRCSYRNLSLGVVAIHQGYKV